MTACEVWVRRDWLARHGYPDDIPPCGHSAQDCPPIKTEEPRMARLLHVPDQHNCYRELEQLGPQPIGTIAECSCNRQWVMRDSQRDGKFWTLKTQPTTEAGSAL